MVDHFRIPHGLCGGMAERIGRLQEPSRFVDKPCFEHCDDTLIDPQVQLFSLALAGKNSALRRQTSLLMLQLAMAERFAGQKGDFQSSRHTSNIVGM